MYEFQEFPKIPRLSRDIVVSEKIDGSNAQVFIEEKALLPVDRENSNPFITSVGDYNIAAGSRNRWLQPGKNTDNYGFAAWVVANRDDLVKLGPGRHYGEWWGQGIQSGYGLKEKRFSLFNTGKWLSRVHGQPTIPGVLLNDPEAQGPGPNCCHVVPVLYQGPFSTAAIDAQLEYLRFVGSQAAPGFMEPEGIVIYHVAGNLYFKKTIVGDDKPKEVK